jgi:hypothetical protein
MIELQIMDTGSLFGSIATMLERYDDEYVRLRRKSSAHKRNIREMQAKLRILKEENLNMRRELDAYQARAQKQPVTSWKSIP